jgi:hypothetical protein
VSRISRQPFPIQIIVDQNEPENVEYFNDFGRMITKDARCAREIKSRIAMTKSAEENFFTRKLDLNLRKKVVECNNLCIVPKIERLR